MRRFIFLTLSIVLSVGFFTYSKFFKSIEKKEINLSIINPVKSFDPAIAFNDDSLVVIGQYIETLYQYHYLKRPFEVIPSLAADMPDISSDGLTYTIKIKKGIKYHQNIESLKNREVKAEDFIWQIKRLAFKKLKSTGTWLFKGKIKGFDDFSNKVGMSDILFYKKEISGLRALDDYTLQIELVRPEPNLLYFLAMPFCAPIPKEILEEYNNDLKDVQVGVGPYIYQGFNDNKYTLEKNSNYHMELYPTQGDRYANTQDLLTSSKKKLPFIDIVHFHVQGDENKRWNDFFAQKIDILGVPKKFLSQISNRDSEVYRKLQENKTNIKQFSRQTSRWLGFNMNDSLVGKNRYIRKAIAHAINYDLYLELLTNNTSLRANSIFNPSISGYRPSHSVGFNHDIQKAKKLIEKSGLTPGEINITYSTRGKQEIHLKEAEFLQSQLSEIGINLKIDVISFSDFLKKGRAGKLQFWTDNWIYDYPDSENILQLLISENHPGINKSGYSNHIVDEKYKVLSKTLNPQKRLELMYSIEKEVEKDLPWIMLMYESTYILSHKKIKNYRKSFFIRNFVKYLDIK